MRDFQSVFLDKLQQERQTVTIITTIVPERRVELREEG